MTRRILGPALARTSESGDRTYTWDFPWPDFVPGPARREFYSVTTLINGGLPKWLMAHYAKKVADLGFVRVGYGESAMYGAIWDASRKRKGLRDAVEELKDVLRAWRES